MATELDITAPAIRSFFCFPDTQACSYLRAFALAVWLERNNHPLDPLTLAPRFLSSSLVSPPQKGLPPSSKLKHFLIFSNSSLSPVHYHILTSGQLSMPGFFSFISVFVCLFVSLLVCFLSIACN